MRGLQGCEPNDRARIPISAAKANMIPLLTAVAVSETVVAFCIASQAPPLVKLGQNLVEVVRSNKGARVVAKSVTGAFVIRLASDVSSTMKLRRTGDQVLAASQLVEIALICFVLILELVLSSLDNSLKRAGGLKRDVNVLQKKIRGLQADYLRLQDEVNVKLAKEEEKALTVEVNSQKQIIFDLRQKLEQTQVDVISKERELKSLRTNMKALEKQTEGFQNEYIRVLDDNENLRIQLSLFDRKYSNSGNKKNS